MEPLKTIFAGGPGTSKTVQIHGYPRPMIVANIDRKVHTMNHLFREKLTKKLAGYHEYDPMEKLVQHIPLPKGDFPKIDAELRAIIEKPPMNENGEPGTFVIDSLSTLTDHTLFYALDMRQRSGKSVGLIQIPDFPEWHAEHMFLASLLTECKDMPCHVILIGHIWTTTRTKMLSGAEKSRTGAAEETIITRQMTTGGSKIGAKIPVWFDECYNFVNIPSTYQNEPPRRVVYSSATDEVPFARTKLPLPYKMDVTYPYYQETTDPEAPVGKPLWDYVKEAAKDAEAFKDD